MFTQRDDQRVNRDDTLSHGPDHGVGRDGAPVDAAQATASDAGALTGPRSFWRWLALIVGIAFLIRFGYVAIAKQQLFSDQPEKLWSGDQIYYSGQARWLADGFGFQWRYREPIGLFETPAADHPPLTAVMMTPASFFEQGFLGPQRYLMAFFGTITVGLIGMLGRRVAGPRVGLVAAFLAAVYPNFWLNDGVIMSEGPTVMMTVLFLLAIYRFHDSPSVGNAALAGLCVGLAALGRAEMALLLPLVVIPVALRLGRSTPDGTAGRNGVDNSADADKGGGVDITDNDVDVAKATGSLGSTPALGHRVKLIAVAAGISLLTVSPWIIPNLFRFEEPVLMSTNDGLTIVGTNCEPAYEGGGVGFWHFGCAVAYDAELEGLDQSQRSSFLRKKGFEFMFDNLDRLPGVMVARVGRLWSVYEPKAMTRLNTGEGREPGASELARFMLYPMMLLAIAGGRQLRRNQRTPVWPLAALAVLVTIVGALFYGIVRFRAPAEISLVVLTAVALVELFHRYGKRTTAVEEPIELT